MDQNFKLWIAVLKEMLRAEKTNPYPKYVLPFIECNEVKIVNLVLHVLLEKRNGILLWIQIGSLMPTGWAFISKNS
jgi:hypothetical protein